MKIKTYRVFVSAFLALVGVGLAQADAVTDTNVLFTASVTGSTVTLDIQCLKSAICGSWYLGDVALKGFTFSGSPSSVTEPPGYSLQNGGASDSTGGCNGTQTGKAVCWAAQLPLSMTIGQLEQLGGGSITFTAHITNGLEKPPLHVQTTAYSNPAEVAGSKVLAPSDDLSPVSEPDPLVLVASGSLILALVRRCKPAPKS